VLRDLKVEKKTFENFVHIQNQTLSILVGMLLAVEFIIHLKGSAFLLLYKAFRVTELNVKSVTYG